MSLPWCYSRGGQLKNAPVSHPDGKSGTIFFLLFRCVYVILNSFFDKQVFSSFQQKSARNPLKFCANPVVTNHVRLPSRYESCAQTLCNQLRTPLPPTQAVRNRGDRWGRAHVVGSQNQVNISVNSCVCAQSARQKGRVGGGGETKGHAELVPHKQERWINLDRQAKWCVYRDPRPRTVDEQKVDQRAPLSLTIWVMNQHINRAQFMDHGGPRIEASLPTWRQRIPQLYQGKTRTSRGVPTEIRGVSSNFRVLARSGVALRCGATWRLADSPA